MAKLKIDEKEWDTLTDSLGIIRYWRNFMLGRNDLDEKEFKSFMRATTEKIMERTGIHCPTALMWIDAWSKAENSELMHTIEGMMLYIWANEDFRCGNNIY